MATAVVGRRPGSGGGGVVTTEPSGTEQHGRSPLVRLVTALLLGVPLLALVWFGWSLGRTAWLDRSATRSVQSGDWASAARALDSLLWYRPGDAKTIRRRVEVAEQTSDRATAIHVLGLIRDDAPDASLAHLQRGLFLKDQFQSRDAESAFRKAIALTPRNVEARRELIALLGIERRASEQVEELWGLHGRGGRPIEALRLLGQSEVVIPPGALAKTIDEGIVLTKCLESDPDDPHLRPPLARYHRRRGDIDVARRLLEPWLDTHPDDAPARLEWLACRLDEGEIAATTPWFDPLSPDLATSADYRRLRGDWFLLQGQPPQAVIEHEEAVRLAPRDPEARYRLGQSLRGAGRAADSEQALAVHQQIRDLAERAAAVSADAPDLEKMRAAARTCLALGPARHREAAAWLAAILRLRPDDPEARAQYDALSKKAEGGA